MKFPNWLLTLLLGPIEYGNADQRLSEGPKITPTDDMFEVVRYIRKAWFRRLPRFKWENNLYHVRYYLTDTRFQILILQGHQVHDDNGRRIKRPTFDDLVQMWWITTPLEETAK